MSTNKQEQLQSQMNVEDQHNSTSSKIVTNDAIEGTPFRIVGTEQGWFIGIGNHRLTEILPEREDAEILVSTKDWNLLTALVMAIMDRRDRIIADDIRTKMHENITSNKEQFEKEAQTS